VGACHNESQRASALELILPLPIPSASCLSLFRSSALRLQQSDDLLGLVEEMEQIITKSENSSLVMSKFETLKNAIIEMEQRNCRSDGFMYNQLAQLSRKVHATCMLLLCRKTTRKNVLLDLEILMTVEM